MKYFHKPRRPSQTVYSTAFKIQVVKEVMSGLISKDGARRKYNIGGKSTILKWCRSFGKTEELGVKISVRTQKECDEVTELKRRIKELENQLDYERFKNDVLETYKEVLERDYGISLPKKPGAKPSAP